MKYLDIQPIYASLFLEKGLSENLCNAILNIKLFGVTTKWGMRISIPQITVNCMSSTKISETRQWGIVP